MCTCVAFSFCWDIQAQSSAAFCCCEPLMWYYGVSNCKETSRVRGIFMRLFLICLVNKIILLFDPLFLLFLRKLFLFVLKGVYFWQRNKRETAICICSFVLFVCLCGCFVCLFACLLACLFVCLLVCSFVCADVSVHCAPCLFVLLSAGDHGSAYTSGTAHR